MDDRLRLSAFEQRLVALQMRRGTAQFVLWITVWSVALSLILTVAISWLAGMDEGQWPIAIVTGLVVPAIVAPLVSFGAARLLSRLDAAVNELETLAHVDPLTGQSNRRHFFAAAPGLVAETRRAGGRALVGMLDLDDFKMVNDTLGHAAGDEILRALAAQVRAAMGPDGLIGRLGGDEFALVVPVGADAEQAVARLEAACRLVQISETVAARASLGLVDGTDLDLDEALQKADAALYVAKSTVVRETRRSES